MTQTKKININNQPPKVSGKPGQVHRLACGLPCTQQSRRARRDDCIARTMCKPDRTELPAVAALLVSSDLRLLVRHVSSRAARRGGLLVRPG
jgi:hypothetical protein